MNDLKKVYLDYSATTPLDEQVLAVMLPYFSTTFGNPSSIHTFGQQAEAALEMARESIASQLHCQPNEIVFTSGGTESDNLALRGVSLAANRQRGANHILISPVEHPAVTRAAQQLAEQYGFELEYLPVDEFGRVNPQTVSERIRETTALVSVIYANNEIGTINPIEEIGLICREKGIPLHSDAVQAAGYLNMDVSELNVDLLALGAHKFYGPKGVGLLYVREGIPLVPILTGGGQEHNRRAGTHNIPYIIGMAKALQLAQAQKAAHSAALQPVRDFLIGSLLEEIPDTRLTGHPAFRLPHHASFVFQGVDGNALLMLLDIAGFACSSGSACKTGDPEPSDALTALGLERNWALGSLRVTLGKTTTPEEVRLLASTLPDLIQRLRKN